MTPSALTPRRTTLRVVVVAQLIVAALTATTVAFAYNHLDGNIARGPGIHHHNRKLAQTEGQPHQPLNILLLGDDTRSGPGNDIDNETGGGGSDTTILLHVAADRDSAYGISIPRDLLVDRPDCSVDGHTVPGAQDVLWNQAYALGGPSCTVEQAESVFAPLYIDDYLTIDFGGFKDMVDAVGGVSLCIPQELDDPKYTHSHFDAGESVHLDGTQALAYVRLRHVLDGTDIGRMKRQQAFIAALVNQVISADTLTRPDRLLGFANALTSSLQASPDLASAGALVKLASSLRDADLAHIRFVTMPSFLYAPGTAGYPHVGLGPEHHELIDRVVHDEPLGMGAGVISAKGPKKHPSDAVKAAAAAAGICA